MTQHPDDRAVAIVRNIQERLATVASGIEETVNKVTDVATKVVEAIDAYNANLESTVNEYLANHKATSDTAPVWDEATDNVRDFSSKPKHSAKVSIEEKIEVVRNTLREVLGSAGVWDNDEYISKAPAELIETVYQSVMAIRNNNKPGGSGDKQ